MIFLKAIAFTIFIGLFSCSESPTSSNPFDDDASDETQARGSVSGYVHDPYGSTLSGVSVSLVNEQLVQGGFTTTTNQLGFFRVNDVLAGTYEVTFTASGTDYLDTSFDVSLTIGEQKTLPQPLVMAFPVTVILVAQSPFTHPVPDTVTVAFGRDSSALPVLTRSGYSFAGWWTQPSGAGREIIQYSDTAIGEAGLLYALWNPEGDGGWTDNGTTLIDPDGNQYTTVVIGNQRWTVENLRTTKYADGTAIPYLPGLQDWSSASSGAFSVYSDQVFQNSTYIDGFMTEYGAHYNWWVVDPANEHSLAAPEWRVPTDADWSALIDHLGGESVAGEKMSDAGTNESGFTAFAEGGRWDSGFYGIADEFGAASAFWWSASEPGPASEYGPSAAYSRQLDCVYWSLYRHGRDKRCGYSVRLVQDVN